MTGAITEDSGDKHNVSFVLWDVVTEKSLGSFRFNHFSPGVQRLVAHKISNFVYEQVAGQPGVFHTKIAYVLRYKDGMNELKVADYDGYNDQTILSSKNNIISPSWSSDGNTLLYVSFERRKPVVYRQSLLTGERQVVANFKGSNSAPAMSPDGRRIAIAATFHGGIQQIYIISENTRERLRESEGVDTEPSFSPDGTGLFLPPTPAVRRRFMSKIWRRGCPSPELRQSLQYRAELFSNGRQVVFLRKDDNGYNISLMDVDSGKIDVLTAIGLADSPSYRRMTPWRYLRTKNAPITCLPFRLMVKLCYHWIFGRRGL